MAAIPARGTPARPKAPFTIAEREIELYEPTEGQWFVITRIPKMIERGEIMPAVEAFGDLLDEISVDRADALWLVDQLVNNKLDMGKYLDLALDMMRHYGQVPEEAPRNGPAPRKRAARARR